MSAFQRLSAPNPAGLDPSALEQIYAQGVSRKLGPGMLMNLGLVEGSRERDRQNLYLENLNNVNAQAMQAGRMELDHNANMELLKQGVDALIKDPRLAGTALGQGATARGAWGAGGQGTLNLPLLTEMMNTGVMQKRSDNLKTAGEGTKDLATAGYFPDLSALSQQTQMPLDAGTPLGTQAAAAGNTTQDTVEVDSNGLKKVTQRVKGGANPVAQAQALLGSANAADPASAKLTNRDAAVPSHYAAQVAQGLRMNPGFQFRGIVKGPDGKDRVQLIGPGGVVRTSPPLIVSPPAR